jgi:NADH dehydrogenase FAD-containing subunit
VGSRGGTPLEQPIKALRNNAKLRRKYTVMVLGGGNSMVELSYKTSKMMYASNQKCKSAHDIGIKNSQVVVSSTTHF